LIWWRASLKVNNRWKNGNSQYQNQPFQVIPGKKASEVQHQYENGDDVKYCEEHQDSRVAFVI
jgi:hypothetical protein